MSVVPPTRWRAVLGAVLATAIVLSWSGPAAADPPVPTNYRARVLSIDPSPRGVAVEIRGGDSFVGVEVDPGHTVVVPDYGQDHGGRPYLRFGADGTVERNERSVAASANETRYGTGDDAFDPEAEPRWRTVATDGHYAWHDHRIHLMVSDRLAVVDDAGRVDLGGPDGTWEVLLVVDDRPTTVVGELVRLDAPSPWPWYGLAVVAFLALAAPAILTGRVPWWIAGTALAITAGAASTIAVATHLAAPPGSGSSPLRAVVTGVGLAAAVVGVMGPVLFRHRGRRIGTSVVRPAVAAGAAVVIWWGVTQSAVLDHALVPSDLGAIDRLVTAVALGVGPAAATVLVWRPRSVEPGREAAET